MMGHVSVKNIFAVCNTDEQKMLVKLKNGCEIKQQLRFYVNIMTNKKKRDIIDFRGHSKQVEAIP